MKVSIKLLILSHFGLFLMVWPLFAQEKACNAYQRYPIPGHPVEIIELHTTDKSFQFLSELSRLKLILLEPGICEVEMTEKGWFRGQVFVFKSRSANFTHGDIVLIEAGRFR